VEDFLGSNVMMSCRFIAWRCLLVVWENGWKDTELAFLLGCSACRGGSFCCIRLYERVSGIIQLNLVVLHGLL
jgi:hypothetical protein